MKKNNKGQKNTNNYNISNISPIKVGNENLNSKSRSNAKKEDITDSFSNKDQDKEELLSFSSEDLETKMIRLLDIKKKGGDIKNIKTDKKKEPDSVNKLHKKTIQKKQTKNYSKQISSNHIQNLNKVEPSINEVIIDEEEKDKKIEEKKLTNNFPKKIDEKNLRKVKLKKKNLELLKQRQKEYLDLINSQKKKREYQMKILDEQINKQNEKYSKLYDGKSVSNTESIEEDLNPQTRIENGFALLVFIFKNNLAFKKLHFLENFLYLYPKRIGDNNEAGPVRSDRKKRTRRLTKKLNTHHGDKKKDKDKEKEKEEEQQQFEEIEEFSINEERDQFDDNFIKLNHFQLVEYDLFYKEQFFKDEVFKYDVENIEDKEEKEINKEMNKLDCKRRLTEKKKLKEVNDLKGIDTTELDEQIKKLTKEYEKIKRIEEPKVELDLNNTEKLLQKGRILGYYFNEGQKRDYPHFSMRGEKEIGAEEIIDFKVLRKEEQARRFFDYSCCMEERKKINKGMVYMRFWCRLLVDNPIFDYLSLLVIIGNTILILISDPTDSNNIGNVC